MNRLSADGPTIRTHRARAFLFVLVFSLPYFAGCAADGVRHRILFGDAETRLTRAEMADIVQLLGDGFIVSADGAVLAHPDCGDLNPTTEIVDLNRDSTFEVFVHWGNACTSGATGRSLTLFVKGASGRYEPSLGFPAFGWSVLDAPSRAWPHLVFGGPGFCHAVWHYAEDRYRFKCNLPEAEGGCAMQGNVCSQPSAADGLTPVTCVLRRETASISKTPAADEAERLILGVSK